MLYPSLVLRQHCYSSCQSGCRWHLDGTCGYRSPRRWNKPRACIITSCFGKLDPSELLAVTKGDNHPMSVTYRTEISRVRVLHYRGYVPVPDFGLASNMTMLSGRLYCVMVCSGSPVRNPPCKQEGGYICIRNGRD